MGKTSFRNALVIVFLGVLAVKFFLPGVLEPLQRKREQLKLECEQLQDLQNRLRQIAHYMDELKSANESSLPADVNLAAIRYQQFLRRHCDGCGLEEAAVSLQDSIRVDGLGIEFPATITGSGRLTDVAALLDRLSATPLNQQIVHTTLKEVDAESQLASFEISTLALSLGIPSSSNSLPQKLEEERGFSDFLSNQRFGRFIPKIIAPIEVEPLKESIANEVPLSPQNVPQDRLDSTRLVAIVERGGEQRAWFHDSFARIDWIVDREHSLQVGDFVATVDRIEGSRVEMRQGFREFSVELGHSIRESLSATVR